MAKRILSLLSFFFIIVNTVSATDYYVSNSGNNSNTGLSESQAFLTIQHAADLVVAGDVVYVLNGTYAGFDVREKNGEVNQYITFKAKDNNVIINQKGPKRNDGINIENCNYIIVDGFIVNNMIGNGNGIRVVVSDHCIVRNNRCDNNAERAIFTGFTDDILIENNICSNSIDEHGIYVSNSSDRPIIRYNECFGNNSIGIHMNGDLSVGGDGIISDPQIYGNIIHDNNKAAGINMDGVENPIVYNNLIYNNHNAQGIALFKGDGAIVTNGAKIYNNTIIVPSDGRWGILVQAGANINTEIFNNIIINEHAWRGCIAVASTLQFKSDYNILNDKMSNNGDGSSISLSEWQALGFDTNSLIANNLSSIFVAPESNNYQLVEGSQAIDNGSNLVNSVVTYDINKNDRPAGSTYDIGAYEFNATASIDENNFSEVIVFPNPTSDYLSIKNGNNLNDIKYINIYDGVGKRITSYNSPEMMDVRSLSPGLYFLELQTNTNQIINKKVIIY
ncbi:T9SS type A sorting domain-containing protein [Aureibaculum algae]|uniref:T9SS type A sorting domain-containing protein n=1 Tax=Aureibaculum algae TaxID=2584122 RepID=A0A5B7TVG4_9FLAO|nr:T9SS type A sorting domain-containing protein [Aureibaculum algae]QCX39291.1 T9SS type A sorting domain-containing protein [Aureibaculum algae]